MIADQVSLVATVLNESDNVDALLASIRDQRRQPDEVVIVDGGSTDGTWETLQTWKGRLPLRALREPGLNISGGRNRAIREARCNLVAVTDAGVRLDPDWLARLLARLEPGIDVVGGFFQSDPRGVFETALGATTLPALEDIDQERFLPSSRSVLFRRPAWERVGGYPEWLDYCEDLVFDLALKRAGCSFAFAPDAVVHFRPRSTVRAFARQYFLYARGDGKADLWRIRHAIRYATYLTAAALLFGLPARRIGWIAVLGGAALYTRRPFARLIPSTSSLSAAQAAAAVALVPLIRAVGDVAKMVGYPVGVAWRLRCGPGRW